MKINYMFATFNIFPPPPKKERNFSKKRKSNGPPPDNPPQEQEKKSEFSKLFENIKDKNMREALKKCLKLLVRIFKKFSHHIIIDKLVLNLAIASEDAAKTALIYGAISSVLYPIFGTLKNYSKCKNCSCKITPGFLLKQSHFNFNLSLYVKPVFFVFYMIPLIIGVLRLCLHAKRPNN